MIFIKKCGYLVFYVTEANGAVPLYKAKIVISVGDIRKNAQSKKTGMSASVEFDFSDCDQPFLCASAKVSLSGYKELILSDIKIYPNVKTVRIANLERI